MTASSPSATNRVAPRFDAEDATRQRYSAAAQAREDALCCPVDYDRMLLEAIRDEVIERDYGCGDPSRYVRAGETVLDLGSGDGKICFIASQLVISQGRVIGIDMNDEMLGLARESAAAVAENIGYANVEFRRGRIQEPDFLKRLEAAGVYEIEIGKWESEPSAVVEGIEFRSATVLAKKGKEGPCMEAGHAIVYKGPWKQVIDDDGHTLERGVRTAVCAKTFRILSGEPYAEQTIGITPGISIPEDEQSEFDCTRREPRHPKETKGTDYRLNKSESDSCC